MSGTGNDKFYIIIIFLMIGFFIYWYQTRPDPTECQSCRKKKEELSLNSNEKNGSSSINNRFNNKNPNKHSSKSPNNNSNKYPPQTSPNKKSKKNKSILVKKSNTRKNRKNNKKCKYENRKSSITEQKKHVKSLIILSFCFIFHFS